MGYPVLWLFGELSLYETNVNYNDLMKLLLCGKMALPCSRQNFQNFLNSYGRDDFIKNLLILLKRKDIYSENFNFFWIFVDEWFSKEGHYNCQCTVKRCSPIYVVGGFNLELRKKLKKYMNSEQEREKQEKLEREKLEREKLEREKLERQEKLEREKQEKEKQEKQEKEEEPEQKKQELLSLINSVGTTFFSESDESVCNFENEDENDVLAVCVLKLVYDPRIYFSKLEEFATILTDLMFELTIDLDLDKVFNKYNLVKFVVLFYNFMVCYTNNKHLLEFFVDYDVTSKFF